MRTRITLTLSALLLSGSLSLASGCGNGNTDNNLNETGTEGNVRQNAIRPLSNAPPGGYNATADDNNQIPGAVLNGNEQGARISEAQLARIAEQVPGVERADIAMNGTDVLVGIELDDNASNRRIVEKQVTSALLWQYAEYRYHVTSDEALRSKIKSAGGRKSDGSYSAQMFDQDIKALARRIDQSMTRR